MRHKFYGGSVKDLQDVIGIVRSFVCNSVWCLLEKLTASDIPSSTDPQNVGLFVQSVRLTWIS